MVQAQNISLANVPLFAGLSPDVLAPLQATCRRLNLERGDFLIRQEEKGRQLYIIEFGQVRVWQNSEANTDLAILGANEVVGELEIIDGQPSSANVQALEPTQVLVLSREAFYDHLGQFPGLAVHMLTILSDRLRRSNTQRLHLYPQLAPESRTADLLLILTETGSIKVPDLSRFLPKMAHILALDFERLEAILEQWQHEGLISLADDSLSIYDRAALQKLAAT
jgi:CRP-like cAMP-binding protein